MSIVLDYTQSIRPAALKSAGVVGVCRYLSYSSASWKVIQQREYDELVGAGLEVFLNWEFDARDWGTPNGEAHGREAVRQAKMLRYPPGHIIWGSADFDMSIGAWSATGRIYALHFAAVIRAAGYRPGVYGPWDVLEWVRLANIMDAFWQAGMSKAWSAGRNAKPYPHALLRQIGHISVGGVDADRNEYTPPAPKLSGKDDTMYVRQPDGKVWAIAGGGVKHWVSKSEWDRFDPKPPVLNLDTLDGMKDFSLPPAPAQHLDVDVSALASKVADEVLSRVAVRINEWLAQS